MTFAFERVRETDFANDAVGQALALAHKGYHWRHGDPGGRRAAVLWMYSPPARQNALQALLYRAAWDLGVAPLAVLRPHQCLEIPWEGPRVLHLHWLNGVTNGAATEAEANDAVRAFEVLLEQVAGRGISIVWTVHNVLPHDSRWPSADILLRRIVARHARVIHTMTRHTIAESAPYFTLEPEKVVQVPHPLYAGVYPDYVSADEARFQIGLAPDDVLLLSFGAVHPYKGYDVLMRAFDAAVAHRQSLGLPARLRLLVAGYPAHAETAGALRRWQAGREDVSLRLKRILETEVQYLFRAADAVVCPYERTLNSGVALLAATFGVPVVGPRRGGFTDNLPSDLRRLYDQDQPDGLLDALVRIEALHPRPRTTDRATDELAPEHISREFLSNSLDMLQLR